jgi:hypothetical protein
MPWEIDLAGPGAGAAFARLCVEGLPGIYEEILHIFAAKALSPASSGSFNGQV